MVMSNSVLQLVSPTALLYIFLSLSHIAQGVYWTGEIEPPPGFLLIYGAGFLWIVAWWLLQDSRKRGITQVYDIGYFLYVAWPLIMPYYLLKTRGVKGLLLIFVFIAVYIGTFLVGMGLYLLLAPSGG